jgi:hypothetical protein
LPGTEHLDKISSTRYSTEKSKIKQQPKNKKAKQNKRGNQNRKQERKKAKSQGQNSLESRAKQPLGSRGKYTGVVGGGGGGWRKRAMRTEKGSHSHSGILRIAGW